MSTSYANAFGDQDREAIRKQDVHKQIKDAFSLFDKDAKGVCGIREIGTIVATWASVRRRSSCAR